MLVAKIAHALQVPLWRDDDSVRAGHRLQHHRRDRLRAFINNDLFQVVEIIQCELSFGNIPVLVMEGRAVAVGVQEMNHSGHEGGFPRQTARIASQRHRSSRRTVIRAISCQDLVFPRVGARQFNGVLIGLRPA